MAIVYSRLATSFRSLAMILPIHLHLLSLASTCATASLITIRMPMKPNNSVRALTHAQHRNRDPLGPGTVRHPQSGRRRALCKFGPRCKLKHNDGVVIRLSLEQG